MPGSCARLVYANAKKGVFSASKYPASRTVTKSLILQNCPIYSTFVVTADAKTTARSQAHTSGTIPQLEVSLPVTLHLAQEKDTGSLSYHYRNLGSHCTEEMFCPSDMDGCHITRHPYSLHLQNNHSLSCPKYTLPAMCHNEVHYLTVKLLTEVL